MASKSNNVSSEDDESIALMTWVRVIGRKRYPELEIFHHIPNGGHRYLSVARKLKEMGVLPGVHDYFLPAARKGFHGLYIELKSGVGKPSPTQKWFMEKVREQNFKSEFCYGWEEAKDVLEDYLNE